MFKRFLLGVVLFCGCASAPFQQTSPPATNAYTTVPAQADAYSAPQPSPEEPSCLVKAALFLGTGLYFLTGIGGPPL
jgi:hypothetical protein